MRTSLAFQKQLAHPGLKQGPLNLAAISCKENKEKKKECLPPEALQVFCLTFHGALLFLFGEAKKAWSKTLITPCAPGEFDFSAPRRKESSELRSTVRLNAML